MKLPNSIKIVDFLNGLVEKIAIVENPTNIMIKPVLKSKHWCSKCLQFQKGILVEAAVETFETCKIQANMWPGSRILVIKVVFSLEIPHKFIIDDQFQPSGWLYPLQFGKRSEQVKSKCWSINKRERERESFVLVRILSCLMDCSIYVID